MSISFDNRVKTAMQKKKGGQNIIKHYVDCINRGERPQKSVEDFVVGCLTEIVQRYNSGSKPDYDELFCITLTTGHDGKKKRGHPTIPQPIHERREDVYGPKVDRLIEEGMPVTKAIEAVSSEVSKGFKTVQAYYYRWKKL